MVGFNKRTHLNPDVAVVVQIIDPPAGRMYEPVEDGLVRIDISGICPTLVTPESNPNALSTLNCKFLGSYPPSDVTDVQICSSVPVVADDTFEISYLMGKSGVDMYTLEAMFDARN
jgi:hypothetical protein